MDNTFNSPNAVITSWDIADFFEFGDFHSKEMGYSITKREAPTPDEKEILENIPFSQGVLDFSYMFQERFYENREVKYTMVAFNVSRDRRDTLERETKQRLMRPFDSPVFETFQNFYHWLGKASKVEFEHDERFHKLQCVVTFDVYPFAIANTGGFDDVWDTFDFDNGVATWTKYDIKGTQTIYLFNAGDRPVVPEVEASANFTIVTETGDKYSIAKGKNEFLNMPLEQGLNTLVINGTGTIRFGVFEEVMA